MKTSEIEGMLLEPSDADVAAASTLLGDMLVWAPAAKWGPV